MHTLTLLHSSNFPIARYADALTREAIAPLPVSSLDEITSDGSGSLRVVLVDPAITGNGRTTVDGRTAIVGIGLDEQPKWLTADSIYLTVPDDPSPAALLAVVKRAYQFLYQKVRTDQLENSCAIARASCRKSAKSAWHCRPFAIMECC